MESVGSNTHVFIMQKIKILKSFNTTHYGFLIKGSTFSVSEGFASFAVERMKSAELIEAEKPLKLNKK